MIIFSGVRSYFQTFFIIENFYFRVIAKIDLKKYIICSCWVVIKTVVFKYIELHFYN